MNACYAVTGLAGEEAREALVDAVVSKTYAPNAAGEVARVTFRDGSQRAIYPRDLVSGASLAQIVESAFEAAAVRDLKGDGEGLRREDVLSATENEIRRAVSLLRSTNVHAYLQDLPEDLEVSAVTPVKKAVRNAHRYLRAV